MRRCRREDVPSPRVDQLVAGLIAHRTFTNVAGLSTRRRHAAVLTPAAHAAGLGAPLRGGRLTSRPDRIRYRTAGAGLEALPVSGERHHGHLAVTPTSRCQSLSDPASNPPTQLPRAERQMRKPAPGASCAMRDPPERGGRLMLSSGPARVVVAAAETDRPEGGVVGQYEHEFAVTVFVFATERDEPRDLEPHPQGV